MKNNNRAMLTAAVTGVLLAVSYAIPANSMGEVGECHGVNSCKGTSECGGVKNNKHDCAGKNDCKGKGWIGLTKEACDQKGGKFKAKAH